MHIETLHLKAFGHFKDVELRLRPGLNLIVGRNEAGKSTTLRAVRALLFGFDHRVTDAFRFEAAQLRVGATLVLPSGERLECVRKRGRSNTLQTPSGGAIAPADWNRFVPPLDAAAFDRQFGIGYETLADGSRDLTEEAGSLGGSLVAAAAGMNRLRKLHAALVAQADGLFLARGQRQDINQRLGRLAELRAAISAGSIAVSDWERLDAAERAARTGSERVSAELDALRKRLADANRILAALPQVHLQRRAAEEVGRLRSVRRLSDDFPRRRAQAERKRAETLFGVEASTARCRELRERIAAFDVPAELLARRAEFESLQGDFGTYKAAVRDRPIQQGEMEQLEGALRQALAEFGRTRDEETAAIPADLRLRLQGLAAEGPGIASKAELAGLARRDAADRLERARAAVEALPPEPVAVDSTAVLREVRGAEALERGLESFALELRATDEKIAAQLRHLAGPETTPAAFADRPFPGDEAVREFAARFREADEAERALRQNEKLAETEAKSIARKLKLAAAADDVPDESRLTELRARREHGWALLKSGDRTSAAAKTFVAESGAADMVSAYEACIGEIDGLTDRLLRHADRLSELRSLRAKQDELRERIAELHRDAEELAAERESLETAWHGLLDTAGIPRQGPADLPEWLRNARRLAERIAAADESRRRLEETRRQVKEARGAALALLQAEERAALFRDSLPKILDRLDRLQEADRTRRDRRARAEDDFRQAESLHRKAARQAEETAGALAAWTDAWQACLTTLRLDPLLNSAQAQALLGRLDGLAADRRVIEEKRLRVAQMRDYCTDYRERVRRFAAAAAPESAEEPVERLLPMLTDRMRNGSDALAKRTALEKQLAEEERRVRELDAEAKTAGAELSRLVLEAGAAAPEELAELERLSQERAHAEARLSELDEQLLRIAGAEGPEAFLARCRARTEDELRDEIERLEARRAVAEAERDALNETIGKVGAELARMQGGDEAALAEAELQGVLAEIHTLSERYVRVKAAAFVLDKAIKQYGERRQGSVVQRASELFRHLTGGSFGGLLVEVGDKGTAYLCGVRPGGDDPLTIEAMSTGTRDQLFLALRLATLEEYYRTHPAVPALPTVIDDCLIMFDDPRAAAALRAFAELSRTTQVLYFTHHRHLVDVARKADLPDLHVAELGPV